MLFVKYLRIPENLRNLLIGIILFGCLLFILDFSFGPILTEIFSKLQNTSKPVLIFTPYYLQLIISLTIIYVGIFSDRIRERMRRRREVDKILPLIEFELRANLKTITEVPPINISKDDFLTGYWDIYKGDLRGWEFTNIIPLTEVYGTIFRYDENRMVPIIERLKSLIESQLNKYKTWYSDEGKNKAGKEARDEKQKAIEQLESIHLSPRYLIALFEMKDELNEIREKLNEK